MKKNTLDKLDLYKLKTSEELLKYYQEWADNNKYNKDMVVFNYTIRIGSSFMFAHFHFEVSYGNL